MCRPLLGPVPQPKLNRPLDADVRAAPLGLP
jgi:hypothetical protein